MEFLPQLLEHLPLLLERLPQLLVFLPLLLVFLPLLLVLLPLLLVFLPLIDYLVLNIPLHLKMSYMSISTIIHQDFLQFFCNHYKD